MNENSHSQEQDSVFVEGRRLGRRQNEQRQELAAVGPTEPPEEIGEGKRRAGSLVVIGVVHREGAH